MDAKPWLCSTCQSRYASAEGKLCAVCSARARSGVAERRECVGCQAPFTVTWADMDFLYERARLKGWTRVEMPRLCESCRRARRAARRSGSDYQSAFDWAKPR